jgi:ribonuclease HI
MSMEKVEIYTDGACKGNPGRGGWGAWLVAGSNEKELFGGERDTTNNRMELKAVIEALTVLLRPCDVIVHTDSQSVQKGLSANRLKMLTCGRRSTRHSKCIRFNGAGCAAIPGMSATNARTCWPIVASIRSANRAELCR